MERQKKEQYIRLLAYTIRIHAPTKRSHLLVRVYPDGLPGPEAADDVDVDDDDAGDEAEDADADAL